MPAVRFEPTISAGERRKTYALDRAATGTGILVSGQIKRKCKCTGILVMRRVNGSAFAGTK
jgi:hypothetical protein